MEKEELYQLYEQKSNSIVKKLYANKITPKIKLNIF